MKTTSGVQHIGELIRDKNIVLKGADVLSQRGFTQVPNHLLRSDKVSAGAKLAYTMLLSYAWHNEFCFPGQERLAKDMGVTSRSVVSYIKELEKEQFLTVQRRGQGRANLYELNLTAKAKRRCNYPPPCKCGWSVIHAIHESRGTRRANEAGVG